MFGLGGGNGERIERKGKNVRSRNSSPSADPSVFALTPRIPQRNTNYY